jgi:glycosyltransferase involved in cell wall biosynthesis
MDPGILVPPNGYGGIERIVAMLAKEYKRKGHEVHLLVTEGSYVEGCVMHRFGKEGFPPRKTDALKALLAAWKFLWKHRNRFDLIHSFGRLAYLLPILNHRVKKIMSYQREISVRNIKWINKLPNENMHFTGCSEDLVSRGGVAGHWQAIHNAAEFNFYTLRETLPADAPLFFLGRIEKIKGCHTAIKVAKATNNKLVIAGNISTLPEEIEYFEREIKPFIDGTQIIFVGEVNDDQKNTLLGQANALLMPIEWNEPFGIVMVEAMACGTPVIGFAHGSVKEVIDESITGYKVQTFEEMCRAVLNNQIERLLCRNKARLRFDISVIADQYLSV